MERRVERLAARVSQARRTRTTSRGYVKKTLVTPARLPDINRRSGVSCSDPLMSTARICSYATNLMAAYGKIRNNVAECPRNNPDGPSLWVMSRIAFTTPSHEPLYFANCGLEAWKRIFTRSRGAIKVFAYTVYVSLLDLLRVFCLSR